MVYIPIVIGIIALGIGLYYNMMAKRVRWLRSAYIQWIDLLDTVSKIDNLSAKELLLAHRALRALPEVKVAVKKFWVWDIEKFVLDREAFNFILEKNNVQVNRNYPQ